MHIYFTSNQLTLFHCLLNFQIECAKLIQSARNLSLHIRSCNLYKKCCHINVPEIREFPISGKFLQQNIHMYSLLVKKKSVTLENSRKWDHSNASFVLNSKLINYPKLTGSRIMYFTHFLLKRTFFSKHPMYNRIEELSNFAIIIKTVSLT